MSTSRHNVSLSFKTTPWNPGRLAHPLLIGLVLLFVASMATGCKSKDSGDGAESGESASAEDSGPTTEDAVGAARKKVVNVLPGNPLDAVAVDAVARAAWERGDKATGLAAWRLLSGESEGLKDVENLKQDVGYYLAHGEGLLDAGEPVTARKLLLTGERENPKEKAFAPLITRALKEDPEFMPPMRTLVADEDVEAIKYLGGGSTVVLRFIKDKEVFAAFKPKQTRQQSDYRAEIAAWRICPMIRCGFDVPYNEPVRIRFNDFHGLYSRLGNARQVAYKENLKDIVPVKDSDGDWVVGTMKAWIPDFVDYPIEITQIWRPWLSLEYEEDVLEGKAADSLKPVELLHPDGERRREKIAAQMGDLSRRDFARQVSNLLVYDFLINNWDRFSGVKEFWGVNCQFKDGRFMSIDNGASFPKTPSDKVEKQLFRVQRFSRRLVNAVRALDKEETLAMLFPNPTEYEKARFDTFWSQRRRFLKYVDELIAEHGEDKILAFD